MRKYLPYLFQGLIALGILVVALVFSYSLYQDKQEPSQRSRGDQGVLVEVEHFERQAHSIVIVAQGSVSSQATLTVKSELQGRLSWMNPKLVVGARLEQGEELFRIAYEEHSLQLSNARLNLRQREAALKLEEAKGRAQAAELALLRKGLHAESLSEEEAAIILRKPQLEEALLQVELAKNAVKLAEIQLKRSVVRAPFAAVVSQTHVTEGALVSQQSSLLDMVASESFQVRTALRTEDLKFLWAQNGGLEAAEIRIKYQFAGKAYQRKARFQALLPAVDSLGHKPEILLAIDSPLEGPVGAPLLLGTYVDIEFAVQQPLEAIALPRRLIREGSQVYLYDAEGRLEIRQIQAVFKSEDFFYVQEGLSSTDKLVSTLISSPVVGRRLRLKDAQGELGVTESGSKAGLRQGRAASGEGRQKAE